MKNYLSEGIFDTTNQLIRKMRITFLMLIVFASSLFATNVNSQDAKVNIVIKNAYIIQVIKAIESQTDYLFVYNKNEIDLTRKVDIVAENKSVADVLSAVFSNTNVVYAMEGSNIMLMSMSDAVQQQKSVSGRVTDSSGGPLPGVSVVVKGTTNGTITDHDGNYSISNVPENATLQFSFVGMKKQEAVVTGKTKINATLIEETIGIEEVVAVGYGTQKKANLTGSIASVSGEELENRPLPNVGEVLRGVSPNLNITLGAFGGEPGSNLDWNIRGLGSISGNDSPLILVDGIEMNINNLDPGNIESVSVLKDASASAIYGSRAPFGVILINTKKGKKGEAISVSYNNNIAFNSLLGIAHMENSLTYATVFNQASVNAGSPPMYNDEYLQRIKGFMDGTFPYEYDPNNPPNSIWSGRMLGNANYDWPHEYLKNSKVDQKHNISLSGGGDKTQYYISLGYYDQNGFYSVGYDDYKRYDVLANFSTEVTKWFKFDFKTKFANSVSDYPLGITTVERGYFFTNLYLFSPLTPKYNINGSLANPMYMSLKDSGRDKTITNDLLVSVGAEIEPVKGWKTNVSYNYNTAEQNETRNYKRIMVEVGTGGFGNIGKPNNAYETNFSRSPYSLFNATTSYEKTLGDHYFKVLAGYEQEEKFYTFLVARKDNLITSEVPSLSTALGASTVDDTKWDWATQGIFGRLNYNYKEKYLFEFSGRYNGSSRFASGKRWVFYPSASAGYQISKESFWEPVSPYINTLKIRASYGALGDQNVDSYQYISKINFINETPWILGGERPVYANTPGLISEGLTWETITTFNLGLDAGFFNNRLAVNIDWFNRKTSDMFGPAETLPYTLGANTPSSNNAELETKGYEIILNWKDRISSDFSYNAQISLGDNKSTILKYKNESGFIDGWYEGKDVGEIWGYITDGIMQTQADVDQMPDQTAIHTKWRIGDMKYKDLTNDDKITTGSRTLKDHGDLTVIGNSSPRFNIGLSGGFNWKGFDFNMQWMGLLKRDYYAHDYNSTFWGLTGGWGNSAVLQGSPVLDYWRPADETNILGPNTDSYFAKPYFGGEASKNKQVQSRFLQDGVYLRLKNIQLGYTIPQNLTHKINIQKARVYVSGGNLITIKRLPKAIDPEQTITKYATDWMTATGAFYPISKSISVGLNLTF